MKNTTELSFFGSVVTFFSGFNLNDLASLSGIIFGLITLLIHWYYKQKDYELKKAKLEKEDVDD
ncbi:HP1 family phage holin [[Pasteurella] aerogenes]